MHWDVYLVRPGPNPVTGIKFRGRTRKHAVERERTMLVENAVDEPGCVRFAVPAGEDPKELIAFMEAISPGITVELNLEDVPNPVLTNKNRNDLSRYR